MARDELFAAIAAQRYRVVDTLSALAPEQWDAPSLCAGWRTRDVLGHLVSILDVPQWKWGTATLRHRGFNTAADRFARDYGDRQPSSLLARYRELAAGTFAPPVVGPIAPLTDVMIHTRDMERPLGIASTLADADLRTVLEFLSGPRTFGFVRRGLLDGLRLEATDLGWSHGAGASVSGPAEALIMAIAGRATALDDLTGDGIATLRSRIAG